MLNYKTGTFSNCLMNEHLISTLEAQKRVGPSFGWVHRVLSIQVPMTAEYEIFALPQAIPAMEASRA